MIKQQKGIETNILVPAIITIDKIASTQAIKIVTKKQTRQQKTIQGNYSVINISDAQRSNLKDLMQLMNDVTESQHEKQSTKISDNYSNTVQMKIRDIDQASIASYGLQNANSPISLYKERLLQT